jgi:hypothetical protein
MKTYIFSLCATITFCFCSYSQSNNPYNGVGVSIIDVTKVVLQDYKDGKIKEINQATIDQYFKALLSGSTIKVDDLNKILSAAKTATSEGIIKTSGFSSQGQTFLTKSLTDYSTTALVDDVKKSSISESEKKSILTVLAVNYNLSRSTTNQISAPKTSKGPNADYFIEDVPAPYVVAPIGGYGVFWGALGFVLGNSLCGPPCGLAGAVVGLMLGSYANNSNSTIGGGGGHHYSSGYPTP